MTKNADSVTINRDENAPQAQAQGPGTPPGRILPQAQGPGTPPGRILPPLLEFFRRLFGREPERS